MYVTSQLKRDVDEQVAVMQRSAAQRSADFFSRTGHTAISRSVARSSNRYSAIRFGGVYTVVWADLI